MISIIKIAGNPDGSSAQDQGYVVALAGKIAAASFSAFHIYVSKSLNWFQRWMWKVCFGVEIEAVDENDRVKKPVGDIGKNETNLEEKREMDKSDKWE